VTTVATLFLGKVRPTGRTLRLANQALAADGHIAAVLPSLCTAKHNGRRSATPQNLLLSSLQVLLLF